MLRKLSWIPRGLSRIYGRSRRIGTVPGAMLVALLVCCSTALSYAAPADVWETGETVCYNAAGGVIGCAGTGQDGELLKGVSWPNPRFADNTNGAVTDNLTGLIWLKNANCFGTKIWNDALTAANSLANGQCGLTDATQAGDWRLPTSNELLSLVDFSRNNPSLPSGHPFTGAQSGFYWSSSSLSGSPSVAWGVNMVYGYVGYSGKTGSVYVWPVRGGQSGLFGNSVISVSPATKDFGPVNPGSSSPAQSFTLTNTGTNTLFTNSITITGADSGHFSKQNDTCSNQTIAPSGTCTVEAVFSPTTGGAKSASLSKPSNAPESPATTALTGTGVQYVLTAAPSGAGSGSITSPVGMACTWNGSSSSGTCSPSIDPGTSVTLTATPDGSSTFSGWSDGTGSASGCTGTEQCVFNINATSSVAGRFKANQTIGAITFSPTTLAFGGTTTASATASSGLAVSFSSTTTDFCTVSGSTVTAVVPGTCTIAANQAGDTNYNAATQVTQNITVGQASQTISFGALDGKTFGAEPFAVSATGGASGNPVTFSSTTTGVCTVSGSTVTIVAAGTCAIAADQAGNSNYSAASQVTQSFTVGKAPQTIGAITFSPSSLAVNGTTTASATASSGLSVSFSSTTTDVCTISGSTITGVTAGTCTIAANQAGDTNYNQAAQVTQNIAVGQASQTISFGALSGKTYGAAPFAVSATGGTSGNPVTFSSTTTGVCTVSGSTVTIVAAGTCTIAANQTGNTNYSAAAQVTQSFTVGQASQTIGAITFSPTTLTFGSTTTASATASSGLTVSFSSTTTDVCTVSGTTVTGVTAGTCTIAANQAGDTNYSAATQVTQNITVGQSTTTTAVSSGTNPSTYGQSVTFTATVTSSDGTPTGTVTFKDGSTTLGTGSLSSGTATYATSALPVTDHSITAVYEGDTNFTTSTSSVLTQTIIENATCGSANGQTFTAAPTEDLCSIGSASAVTGTGPWTWSCGETVNCTAKLKVDRNLPRTGQTKCYNTAGTKVACAATGQDGETQAGAAWPDPRFTDNGDQTVKDNLTGLVWTKDGGTPTFGPCTGDALTWQSALDYVACLNANSYLGHNDWRMPNINEIKSLADLSQAYPSLPLSHPFTNIQSNIYWQSTTCAGSTSNAWIVRILDSSMGSTVKTSNGYVWPVRAGQCGLDNSAICLSKTGQTVSYATGDDGDLGQGVAWPEPRFTASGDCITDNLTGLMWPKNGNLPKGTKTWQGALTYANNLGLCGYTDWRLPNREELVSLIDRSKYSPALPSGHPFMDVQVNEYWSSLSLAANTREAGTSEMGEGYMPGNDKKVGLSVWPVRGNIACNNLTISQTGKSFNYKSSTGSLSVTASPALCTWAVASDSTGWLNINSNSSGTGKGTVKYSVSANTSVSTRTGHITAGDQTFTVTQAGGTPKISAPSSLKMRNVKKDVTSDTKTITIKNIGTANLEISDVTITGVNSSEFTPTNNCTQALAKNETCKVTVTFTPSTKGKRSATLNIGSNDPKKATATVKLSGLGK